MYNSEIRITLLHISPIKLDEINPNITAHPSPICLGLIEGGL